jgi:hypothetical protein
MNFNCWQDSDVFPINDTGTFCKYDFKFDPSNQLEEPTDPLLVNLTGKTFVLFFFQIYEFCRFFFYYPFKMTIGHFLFSCRTMFFFVAFDKVALIIVN